MIIKQIFFVRQAESDELTKNTGNQVVIQKSFISGKSEVKLINQICSRSISGKT